MLSLEDKENLEKILHLEDEMAIIDLYNGGLLAAYYRPEEEDKYQLVNMNEVHTYYSTFESLWDGIKENLNGKRVKEVY